MRERSAEHRRLVASALRHIEHAMVCASSPVVAWSGGKDSTVLSHLALSVDPTIQLVSEKDDLDYPGEEAYVTGLAASWGAALDIVRPPISPAQWVAEHSHEIGVCDDFHSRAAGLSKACFYDVMEEYNASRDLVFLGLRAAESKGRQRNRMANGVTYTRKDGTTICNPLSDWTGLDVFTYLFTHGIEPLHVYRCVGFMHQREPWRIRKSWWIPGSAGRHGGISWLRRYYPSLFARLREWFPRAQSFA